MTETTDSAAVSDTSSDAANCAGSRPAEREGPEGGSFLHLAYVCDPRSGHRSYSNPDSLIASRLCTETDPDTVSVWENFVVPEDRPLLTAALRSAVTSGTPQALTYRLRTLDNGELWVQDCFGAVQGSGNATLMAGSVVSRQVPLAKIMQLERLSLVGRFAGAMIHDLGNLLAGMQAMLESCLDAAGVPDAVDTALRNTLEYARQAGDWAHNAVDLIGGSLGDPELQDVNLPQLVCRLEPLLRNLVPASIELTIDAEPDLPAIRGQPLLLQDALLNLVLNSVDAMKNRGARLQIELVRAPAAALAQADRGIVLRVTDDGRGMSPQHLGAVFNAFFSTRIDGIGLGLWMVRNTVQCAGGTVQVHSREGHGSTFELLFPAAPEPDPDPRQPCPASAAAAATAPNPLTILLVEDEPLVRLSLTRQLELRGCRVLGAADGDAAWALFEEARDQIDLVLQDFIIPGRNGEELLSAFTRAKPDLPVIVISAFPDQSWFSSLVEKGAAAILSKPFEIRELLDAVRKAVPGAL